MRGTTPLATAAHTSSTVLIINIAPKVQMITIVYVQYKSAETEEKERSEMGGKVFKQWY
jgi:hypothetical protein